MAPVPPSASRRGRRALVFASAAAGVVAVVVAATLVISTAPSQGSGRWAQRSPAPVRASAAAPEPPIAAAPAPAGLPVVDYGPPPAGFPADAAPLSTVPLQVGLHAIRLVGVYDWAGGRPLAFLPPTIRGVPLTTPIVERRAGWAAVLLPSVNRTVGWVPPGGWTTVPLRDQLIVERKTHTLTWLRDGATARSWTVTLGIPATPTPLGRTFILGRSRLRGKVYAGTDVFALGAVPDRPRAVPSGLRGAHIGLHTWYHDRNLGKDTTDGCIRLTRAGQQLLLAELAPGTELVVVDARPPR